MTTSSIKSIQYTLNQYDQQLRALPIPNLQTYSAKDVCHTTSSLTSPYLFKFKLHQLSNHINNLFVLFKQIDINHTNKAQYQELSKQFNYLINDWLDERLFIVDKLISEFELSNSPTPITTPSTSQEEAIKSTNTATSNISSTTSVATGSKASEGEDLNSLRQRLLSNKSTKLDESGTTSSHNDYHESLQSDIINELSQLTSSLRNSAYTLSSKLLNEDMTTLNESQENLLKNMSFFKVVSQNLNNYLGNKDNSSISIWFLLKVTVAIVVSFLFIILIIKIIPSL
ncbi:hypothetical protein DFJ63DRAFT_311165 [Scheffersomyces coipomensis]|uniref:uncharacterized protein n=1 Tax=Scheffersomyces coipomensis TaxID=1788519 RepID=UPI00315DA0F4